MRGISTAAENPAVFLKAERAALMAAFAVGEIRSTESPFVVVTGGTTLPGRGEMHRGPWCRYLRAARSPRPDGMAGRAVEPTAAMVSVAEIEFEGGRRRGCPRGFARVVTRAAGRNVLFAGLARGLMALETRCMRVRDRRDGKRGAGG